MDEFFQKLREIQKKERDLSGLAPVGENFYQEASKYFNGLMRKIDNNPFSFESYLLRDAQRIVAEICERREHKISNSAVMNVQRSYQLFKESKSGSRANSPMQVPPNSTPEEEKLYRALVASLVTYREKMRGPLRFYSTPGQKDRGKSDNFQGEFPENSLKIDDNPLANPLKTSKLTSDEGSTQDRGDNKDLSADEILNKEIDARLRSEEENALGDLYRRFGTEPGQESHRKSGTESDKEPGQERDEESDQQSPKESGPETDKKTVKESIQDSGHDKSTISEQSKANKTSKDDPKSEHGLKTNKSSKNHTEVLMILEELPTIMGVDNKVYGPLSPQDIITMPQPNARILIKNQKGRFIQRYK